MGLYGVPKRMIGLIIISGRMEAPKAQSCLVHTPGSETQRGQAGAGHPDPMWHSIPPVVRSAEELWALTAVSLAFLKMCPF